VGESGCKPGGNWRLLQNIRAIKKKLNLKPACNTRQLFSLQKCVAITILKTDSFQWLPTSCRKFLQPDQWLALVEEVCMALKGTDAISAGHEEVIDHFEYTGLCLIAVGQPLKPIVLVFDRHARPPSL